MQLEYTRQSGTVPLGRVSQIFQALGVDDPDRAILEPVVLHHWGAGNGPVILDLLSEVQKEALRRHGLIG